MSRHLGQGLDHDKPFLRTGRDRREEGFSHSAEAGKQGCICLHSCEGSLCFSQDGLGQNAVTSALEISVAAQNGEVFLFHTQFSTGPDDSFIASCFLLACLFVCWASMNWDFVSCSCKGLLRNILEFYPVERNTTLGERYKQSQRLGTALGFTVTWVRALSCFHWKTLKLKLQVRLIVFLILWRESWGEVTWASC